jgi:DNA modification methylase
MYLHPTQKPLELIKRAIKNSSERENIVLDLFGGSGSTLIACGQLDRKCYMMEIDERYCDVIINRWEKLTGLKAEKVS